VHGIVNFVTYSRRNNLSKSVYGPPRFVGRRVLRSVPIISVCTAHARPPVSRWRCRPVHELNQKCKKTVRLWHYGTVFERTLTWLSERFPDECFKSVLRLLDTTKTGSNDCWDFSNIAAFYRLRRLRPCENKNINAERSNIYVLADGGSRTDVFFFTVDECFSRVPPNSKTAEKQSPNTNVVFSL